MYLELYVDVPLNATYSFLLIYFAYFEQYTFIKYKNQCYHIPMQDIDYHKFIERGNDIFRRRYKRQIHLTQPNSIMDIEYAQRIMNDLQKLSNEIPCIDSPKTKEEMFVKELKNLAKGVVFDINDDISKNIATPEEVMEMYCIKQEDIDENKAWLLENRDTIVKANRNLLENETSQLTSKILLEIKDIRTDGIKMAQEHIDEMGDILKKHFGQLPGITELFNIYKIYPEAQGTRSATHKVSKIITIAVKNILSMKGHELVFNLEEFLKIYSHEVLGHGLNFVLTASREFPFFIQDGLFLPITGATKEAVSQYFQEWFFDKAVGNPEICKILGKYEPFELIYSRYKDTNILDKYWSKLAHVGLYALATTKADDHDNQIKEISKYSISPKYAANFVNKRRNEWNKATGLLLPSQVSELRYAVDPVSKVISLGEVSKIEQLILTGCWTPTGLIDWVKFNLENL